jgi:hypothetical protein
MIEFSKFCWFADKKFFNDRKILLTVADELQDFFFDKSKKACNLSMPSRFGKSYLLTLFSVWTYQFKDTRIMRVCTDDSLFNDFSRATRSLTERYAGLIGVNAKPHGTIDSWGFPQDTRPAFFGGGANGTIIGKGANIAIFDDMYKNFAQATSAAYDNYLNSFLFSVVNGRLEGDDYKILNVGTRWSVNDWFAKFNPDKEIILPALNKEGETVCEAWKSTPELLKLKKEMPAYLWNAQYMQRPTLQGRQKIFLKEFITVPESEIPNGEPVFIIDPATNFGSDYFVVGKYIKRAGLVYLIDMFAEQAADVATAAKWILDNGGGDAYCYCETNGYGANVRNILQNDFDLSVIGFSTNKEKYARAFNLSKKIQDLLRVSEACQNRHLLQSQSLDFPTGEHDDLIDNVVMCFEKYEDI